MIKSITAAILLVVLATQCISVVYADGPVCWDTPTPAPTNTPLPTITPDPTSTPLPTNTPMPTATALPTNTPWPTLPILTPEPKKELPTNTPPPKPTNTPEPVIGTPIKFEPTDTPEVTATKRGKYNTPVPTDTSVWVALPNTGDSEPITMGDVAWWLFAFNVIQFIALVALVIAFMNKRQMPNGN